MVQDIFWVRNLSEKLVKAMGPFPERMHTQSFANNFKEVWDLLSDFIIILFEVCGLQLRNPNSSSWLKRVFQGPGSGGGGSRESRER